MSYFIFTDTSGMIPISNKVGNTFVFDQSTSSFWINTYFQNVTIDKLAGFSEEIKYVDENKVKFGLSNLDADATVNAGVEILRIFPIEIE